jgi:hypothetical protein
MDYSREMCPRTLDILGRTVMVTNHPDRSETEVGELIGKLRNAAAAASAAPSA